jgi:hypothetical protein
VAQITAWSRTLVAFSGLLETDRARRKPMTKLFLFLAVLLVAAAGSIVATQAALQAGIETACL